MTQPRKLNKYKYCPNKQSAKISMSLFGHKKDKPRNKGNPCQITLVCRWKGKTQKEDSQKRKNEDFYKICLAQGFKKINKNYLFEEFKDYNIILYAKNKP